MDKVTYTPFARVSRIIIDVIMVHTRCVELCELQARDIRQDCVGPPPYYIPHFKVHLDGCKGWQSKAGYDGPRESTCFSAAIGAPCN